MAVEIPTEVLIWRFAGKTGNVRSQNTYTNNSGYNLFCQTNGAYLTYVDQVIGMNLGYEKTGNEHKVWFRVPDNQERELLTGEAFAFGIGGGKAFMRYESRSQGINLDFVEKPVAQWRAYLLGGELGQPIPTGSMVAILNDKVEPTKDFMIYLDRAPGLAKVGWTSSPNWWATALPAAKLAIEAARLVL
jgi:hypothetical protein